MISISYIDNLIEKREVSPTISIDWSGQTYADLSDDGKYVTCVNRSGVIHINDPAWDLVVFKEDHITFIRSPMGIETAVLIGIAKGALLFAGKLAIKGFIVGGISALVGKLLAPTAQQPGVSKARTNESPAYGFESVTNGLDPTGPMQIGFGEFRTPGSIIATWREAYQNDIFLYVKQFLGEGPIESVGSYTTDQNRLTNANLPDDVFINGIKAKDLGNFLDMNIRLGNDPQSVASQFIKTEREYAQDYSLDKGPDGPFTWRTKNDVTGFRVLFAFRGGLFENDEGSIETQRVRIRLQAFRESDDVEVVNEIRSIVQATRSPFWKDYSSPKLDPGKFRIVATLIEGTNYISDPDEWDQVHIVAVNEIETLPFQHPGIAYVTYKVKASSKLSGGFPTFHVTPKMLKCITGIGKIPLANREWSDNPADVVRTLLLDKTFGAGNIVFEAYIDEVSWDAYKAFCAELIPKYTGSVDLEPRFRFDGVIDTARSFWDVIIDICAQSRCVPHRIGNLIKFTLEEQKLPVVVLNRSDYKEDTFKRSPIGLRQRKNRVEVSFLDRDQDWTRQNESDETAGLSENLGDVRLSQLDAPGVTRKSEARRRASYILRYERLSAATCEFSAGPKSLRLEPGSVVTLEKSFTSDILSGKLVGIDGSDNIQLDQSYTFVSGIVYEYTEINHLSGAIQTVEFVEVGATDILPFEPLHGFSRVKGRSFLLAPTKVGRKDWYVTRITTNGKTGLRDIEAIEYNDLIYTDDAPEKDETPIDPPGLAAPDPITGLAVTGEACTEDTISQLIIEWNNPSPSTDLVFDVYWAFKGSDDYSYLGTTTLEVFTPDIEGLAFGANIVIVVVTVDESDGTFIEIGSAPSVDYQITRESDSCNFPTIPGDVTNIQLIDASQPDGNVYTLSWDAVADVDGYEIRLGSWAAGPIIFRGTALSVSVLLSQVEKKFYVRAFIGNYYSPLAGEISGSPTQYQSFSSATQAEKIFILEEEGSIQNGNVIDVEANQRWLLQTSSDFTMQFISDIVDAGSSANTHVSVEVRPVQTPTESTDTLQIFSDSDIWSTFGLINRIYQTWNCSIQYRTGTSGAWSDLDYGSVANQNITLTARQFRLKFEVITIDTAALFDAANLAKRSLAMLKHLSIALYR